MIISAKHNLHQVFVIKDGQLIGHVQKVDTKQMTAQLSTYKWAVGTPKLGRFSTDINHVVLVVKDEEDLLKQLRHDGLEIIYGDTQTALEKYGLK